VRGAVFCAAEERRCADICWRRLRQWARDGAASQRGEPFVPAKERQEGKVREKCLLFLKKPGNSALFGNKMLAIGIKLWYDVRV